MGRDLQEMILFVGVDNVSDFISIDPHLLHVVASTLNTSSGL